MGRQCRVPAAGIGHVPCMSSGESRACQDSKVGAASPPKRNKRELSDNCKGSLWDQGGVNRGPNGWWLNGRYSFFIVFLSCEWTSSLTPPITSLQPFCLSLSVCLSLYPSVSISLSPSPSLPPSFQIQTVAGGKCRVEFS